MRSPRVKGQITPCCSKVGIKRGPWTAEEDEILADFVKKEGEGRWRTLPKRAGLQRCGKSCRLRWMNYLRPSLKRGHIAPDEEDLILRLHRLLGNRWSLIAGRIPGRTDNEIKNYWNTHLSKKLISQGVDPRTHKPLITFDNNSNNDLTTTTTSNNNNYHPQSSARQIIGCSQQDQTRDGNVIIQNNSATTSMTTAMGNNWGTGGAKVGKRIENNIGFGVEGEVENIINVGEEDNTLSSFLESLINNDEGRHVFPDPPPSHPTMPPPPPSSHQFFDLSFWESEFQSFGEDQHYGCPFK